jgi:transcription initiation factor TFIID subunit 4
MIVCFCPVAKHGMDEPPTSELAAMVSHATQERLRDLLEKLAVISEHRQDMLKVGVCHSFKKKILTSLLACFQLESKYESTQDVRTQLRFLEDLDRMERRRHDEQERELLLRAAKSRSKTEDPEQAKLKAKAKEVCLKSTFPFTVTDPDYLVFRRCKRQRWRS